MEVALVLGEKRVDHLWHEEVGKEDEDAVHAMCTTHEE